MAPAGKLKVRPMWGKARGGLTELLPQSQKREKHSERPGEAVDKATEAANRLTGSPDSAPASHCLWKTHSHMGPRLLPASLTYSAHDPQPTGTSNAPIEREAFHLAWGILLFKRREERPVIASEKWAWWQDPAPRIPQKPGQPLAYSGNLRPDHTKHRKEACA